jgi:hypothetical protein
MKQRILYPNWNNLSFDKKTLIKRFLDSFIRFQAVSREIRISFGSEEQYSESVDDLLLNLEFEIIDSSTTSEGIRLEEIIPPQLIGVEENLSSAYCRWYCLLSNDPDCVRKCREN